jgi:hypothetical protein
MFTLPVIDALSVLIGATIVPKFFKTSGAQPTPEEQAHVDFLTSTAALVDTELAKPQAADVLAGLKKIKDQIAAKLAA